jgi:hypothetical protein
MLETVPTITTTQMRATTALSHFGARGRVSLPLQVRTIGASSVAVVVIVLWLFLSVFVVVDVVVSAAAAFFGFRWRLTLRMRVPFWLGRHCEWWYVFVVAPLSFFVVLLCLFVHRGVVLLWSKLFLVCAGLLSFVAIHSGAVAAHAGEWQPSPPSKMHANYTAPFGTGPLSCCPLKVQDNR